MNDEILVFALENALEHGGKATVGPIMGRMMATNPELKKEAKQLAASIGRIVGEVNQMTPEEMKARLDELGGPIELRKRERKDPMIPLEDTEKGVRMRFAPGPSGPLHIGHTRAAILNDEYCKRYDGKFILRLEDTNPEKIDPEAYSMIPEDLRWMGIDVHETYIQSDRFELYYNVTRDLLEKGHAYVCTMDLEEWREMKANSIPCEERGLDPSVQLEKWDRMIEGHYAEGEASVVVKTDLKHKNPAVRDFVSLRIRHAPHPRTGDRYHLYPLYNFSVAVDDHLMVCTHILRGNDHLNNTYRQKYVYDHMGWEQPYFIHYGLVSIPDTLLKTSLIKEEIGTGKFSGWDDIRLGTVRSLGKRGFDPGSIRRYWREAGVKSVDITFSWETLETMNREIIDPSSERYFFVEDPLLLSIRSDKDITGKAPKHPEFPKMGYRDYDLKTDNGIVRVHVPSSEIDGLSEGEIFRLKDLCNLKIGSRKDMASYEGNDTSGLKGSQIRIIQWAPEGSPEMELQRPDGTVTRGIVERGVENAANEKSTVQFERVGFCRTESDNGLKAYFAHK